MQRFKNILVVYDNRVGDEATLRRATELAKRNAARLTLAAAGNVFNETESHGVRQLVTAPELLSPF
jgi:nucleotide-binding universal stress UspA family protein